MVKISIIGLGFVGLSLTSTLSSKGYKVVGIDIDEKKCEKIRNGITPFFEPGLKNIEKGIEKESGNK